MKKKDIKILLVDDEQDILEIVGYNLSQEGYQIVTASNGKEAIAKLTNKIRLKIVRGKKDKKSAYNSLRLQSCQTKISSSICL